VLSLVSDSGHALVVRAAFHLIDLEVRQAASVATVAAEVRADPPVLVVVEDDVTRPDDLINADVPVVRVPDDAGPLQLLGAARAAAPSLYECSASGSVQPTPEDQVVLLIHDLRRVVEEERMRRAERDDARLATALGLVRTLALRDIETSEHSYRVEWYARALAFFVDPLILDDPTVELGFLLHDVGKLALPDHILFKPGPLDEAELETMRNHPRLGAEIVSGILPAGSRALAVVRSHHERWDGHGYPDGLRGDEIPLAARVFAVVDTLDAISSDRPYRRARTWEEAIRVVRAESGAQFDPRVVEALDRAELDFLPRPLGHTPSAR